MAKPMLNHLLLQDVLIKDVELGVGAYGRVFEVQYAGLTCAAKEIHPIFFRVGRREELERVKANFLRECQIWSTLRHPNIVQFIGVHYPAGDQSGLPIIVMEKMSCSLRSLVERYEDVEISLHQKLSILLDISLGLWYLHIRHPPIVHRDLTPNNILLGCHLEAKITDLGVAKVMTDTDSGRKMTKAPGTPHFMPPEALDDNPAYDTSLDMFSYGAVTLYIITQQWPEPKARERFNPTTGKREVVSEVDRRQEYLDKITPAACTKIKPLIMSCLDDDAENRPKVAEVSESVKELKYEHCDDNEINSLVPVPFAVDKQGSHGHLQVNNAASCNQATETVKITWKEGTPAPVKLMSHSFVYLDGLIYMTGHKGVAAYTIYSFDPAENSWKVVVKTKYRGFSLVVIQNRLVIVGGEFKTRDTHWFPFNLHIYFATTCKLFALDEHTKQWTEYNKMNVSRAFSTAVSYKDTLIITGGYYTNCRTCTILSSTELLNTTTKQWFTCGDLPRPHLLMKSAIVGDTLYLLGGNSDTGFSTTIFTAALDTLSQYQINWKSIQNSPHCRSAPASMCGASLVVMGGYDRNTSSHTCDVSTIDDNHSWKVISQLSEARSSPCVATISDDTILVIGGLKAKSPKKHKYTKTVWFGHLSN